MRNKKRFSLIWIGKTREGFISEGIERYIRLLRPFADVEVIQIKEEKAGNSREGLKSEARRILNTTERFILLHERGRLLDSVEFSALLRNRREAAFVIGGPYGVAPGLHEKAEMVISLSPMTFTHEMVRLILLEQLYRAMTILKGTRYHH